LPSLIADNPVLMSANSTTSSTVKSLFPGGYMLGNIFGPMVTPILMHIVGYKLTILSFSALGIFGQLFSVFSAHYFMLIVGRFICGVSSGIKTYFNSLGVITVAGIAYATSLADPKIRGLVGATFLLGATSFILLANVSAFFSLVLFNWRLMISVGLIPAIILFIVAIFMPESHIWRKEKKEKKKLNILPQIKKILTLDVFWRLFLCFLLILSFQLGGIVPVIIFLPITLESAGLTNFYEITGASIGVAIWNIITALTTVFLVDCFGRRVLLLVGYVIMFFSTLAFGFVTFFIPKPWSGIISIILVFIFLIGNNGGINSIIYFIFNELYDSDIVIVTSAFNLTLLNLVSFIIGWAYLPLESVVGLPAMLWIFSAVTLICATLLGTMLPETKQKKVKISLENETRIEGIPPTEEISVEAKEEVENQTPEINHPSLDVNIDIGEPQ
jgi:MFS family permease